MGVAYPKKTVYPAYKARDIAYGLSDFDASFEARHLREENGELVCAEGAERIYSVPRIPTAIYAAGGEVFIWSARDGNLYRLTDGEIPYAMGERPDRLIPFVDREGKKYLYAVCKSYVAEIGENGSHSVGPHSGGTCGAVFKERLFTASGHKIYYSAPLAPADWTQARGGAGWVELPSFDCGEFIDAIAFREQLFFFRERGIMQLRVNGDDFNFKAIPIRFGGGTIVKGTVADCGDAILFFTDRGLYSFTGGKCTLVENSLFGQISGTPSEAVFCAGNYYAVCTHRAFGKCIYCYDRKSGRAHFILQAGDYLAAGDGVWTLSGSSVYKLTAKGAPKSGSCTLSHTETDFEITGSERMVNGATVQGKGRFIFTARTAYGTEYSAEGNAGERLRLPVAARGGDFTFTVKAEGDFCIKKLTVHAKEAACDH